MKQYIVILSFVLILSTLSTAFSVRNDYSAYHSEVYQAEELIVQESFVEALNIYRRLFENYNFIFVRDYKVATQIAWHLNLEDEAYQYLRLGIAGGWEMKSIKGNKFLKELLQQNEWTVIKSQYDSLRNVFNQNINQEIRAEVREMSLRDQRKALGSVFRIGSKSQDQFGENKFAPLNEKHLSRLMEIIENEGFPGEKLVGYEPWGQGILSRHNSISQAYCKSDTLYPFLRPILLSSINKGNLSPASFAWIDDWFITVESGWSTGSYGYVKQLKKNEVSKSNEIREQIGLRKVETRNQLIDLQSETQMDFYLPVRPAENGKILAN
ncbi:hypothetical protein QWY87_10885 [Lutimonas halocynthiae]|uniref:hypothetical protein n=1 Tax=Lutimonas halocynthiae TaxID=1446477 RepID=UPI0025B4B875|nr:hypothetical protein [Lutimonas halocynthiae]MDN3643208.1 hypothetical protein [Lutimonas halocynthiae]